MEVLEYIDKGSIVNAVIDILSAGYKYRHQAMMFGFAGLVIYCLYFFIAVFFDKKAGFNMNYITKVISKGLVFMTLCVYTSYVIALTYTSRAPGSINAGKSIWFFQTFFTGDKKVAKDAMENVVMFVPFGFIIPILWRVFKRFYAVALYSFTMSLLIETAQLYTSRGSFQIDDIVLNTLGGIIGWMIWRVMNAAQA